MIYILDCMLAVINIIVAVKGNHGYNNIERGGEIRHTQKAIAPGSNLPEITALDPCRGAHDHRFAIRRESVKSSHVSGLFLVPAVRVGLAVRDLHRPLPASRARFFHRAELSALGSRIPRAGHYRVVLHRHPVETISPGLERVYSHSSGHVDRQPRPSLVGIVDHTPAHRLRPHELSNPNCCPSPCRKCGAGPAAKS